MDDGWNGRVMLEEVERKVEEVEEVEEVERSVKDSTIKYSDWPKRKDQIPRNSKKD